MVVESSARGVHGDYLFLQNLCVYGPRVAVFLILVWCRFPAVLRNLLFTRMGNSDCCKCHTWCYEFPRLLHGLTNSRIRFGELLGLSLVISIELISCYKLNYLLVYSVSFQLHIQSSDKVLGWLEGHGLKLNGKTCQLFQTSVWDLGHIVSAEGIIVHPDKTKRLRDWPVLTDLQQLRSVPGLASYYSRLVPGFAKAAEPLHSLTLTLSYKPAERKRD